LILTYQDGACWLAGMETPRRTFASQADPVLLDAVRDIAAEEGRQFQEVLIDEFGGAEGDP